MNKQRLWVLMLLWGAVSGCDTRRELLTEQRVNIRMDWRNLKSGDTPFDQMEVYLYDEQGNYFIKQADRNGYSGSLPPGKYSMLAFNPNARDVVYESLNDYTMASVRTPVATNPTRGIQGRELSQPANLYGALFSEFTVRQGVPTEVNAVLTPHVSIIRVNLTLTGDVNQVIGCRVILSGVSDRLHLATGNVKTPPEKFIISSPEMINTGLKTSLSIFGTDARARNIMQVLLTLDNGEELAVEKDVTEQIKDVNIFLSPNINIAPNIDLTNRMGQLTATIISWAVSNGDIHVEE